ncbi:MAG: UbiD family decarboxylase [Thaumarchaeota archaeon]|nr:UbiD family decarboxylase [Nitrososphaerota archaeon]
MSQNTIDLRSWMALLQEQGLMKTVDHAIDIREAAEIINENYRFATYFPKIRDYNFSLVGNCVSNTQMLSLALGCEERQMLQEYKRRLDDRAKPEFIGSGACQEVVKIGDEVDIANLPIHLQHEYDGAPYISAAVLVAKDPETQIRNFGIYRLMYRSKNQTGINITAPHKLRRFYQKAVDRGKPLEVACVIGLHALDMLGAVSTRPPDEDEAETLGGMRGKALELVKCKTIDVEVPAHAEVVLECEMQPTGWTYDEGPYGEFTGTYSGMKKNPVVNVKAVTHRSDAVFQTATHGGTHMGWTDFNVLIPPISVTLWNALRNANIDVKALRLVQSTNGSWAVASIKQWAMGDSKNALYVLLSASNQNFPKVAVVVDDDIDVYDDEMVYWAMSYRVQPRDKVILLDGMRVPSSADPSLNRTVRYASTSKMGIDATIPFDRFGLPPFNFDVSRVPKWAKAQDEKKGEDLTEIESAIEDKLKHEPLFFYDILHEFSDHSHKSIMRAWGNLTERGLLKRDDRSRYFIDSV